MRCATSLTRRVNAAGCLKTRNFTISPTSRAANLATSAVPLSRTLRKASAATMASTQDSEYKAWSHEDLIKRVTQLENELRSQNERLSTLLPQPTTATPLPKKKPTPFDPSKYTTRPIALKFAYLGARYNGFEHHIGNATPLPTIEEELWKALVKTRLIFPPALYGPDAVTREDGTPLLTGRGGVDEVEKLPATVVGDWTGCAYSKCGRTDRGVSAFGQVVGLTVRSARPKAKVKVTQEVVNLQDGSAGKSDTDAATGTAGGQDIIVSEAAHDGIALDNATTVVAEEEQELDEPPFDPIKDELPYIALLNRVLPSDIRVLAWCPHPPSNFDARFSCKERKYRYFFTSPAFLPLPGDAGRSPRTGHREGWLNIDAMQEAASYLIGTHDFRNLCKVDPSKQLTSFTRRITDANIVKVCHVSSPDFVTRFGVTNTGLNDEGNMIPMPKDMRLYSFDVQGSAFLWHQVRCMVAVLFLVGQGLEKPEVVKELLDVAANPRKPHYEMASDQPLVLWDCMFSVDPDKGKFGQGEKPKGYVDRGLGEDEIDWIYAADAGPGSSGQAKWGPMGLMPDLWKGWRKAKMDEVLASQLLDMVALQAKESDSSTGHDPLPKLAKAAKENQRIYEGYDNAVPRGKYTSLMQKPRMDPVEVINARWAQRKGRPVRVAAPTNVEADDGNE